MQARRSDWLRRWGLPREWAMTPEVLPLARRLAEALGAATYYSAYRPPARDELVAQRLTEALGAATRFKYRTG